jgi:hypothetical protein
MDTWKIKKIKENKKKCFSRVRDTRTDMQQGEESSETPVQVLVQTADVSESVDGPEKESVEKVDGEEEISGEEEEQVGTSWGHAKLPGDPKPFSVIK